MIDVIEILTHWYAGRSQNELATSLGVRAAAKSSCDLVGDEWAVRVAGVVAQGLCDVGDPGQA